MDPVPAPCVPSTQGSFFRCLAHFSWLSIIISIVFNPALASVSRDPTSRTDAMANAILFSLLPVSGIGCGIAALLGMMKYGRNGILRPAVIGLSIWLFLAVIAIPPFLKITRKARLIHAAQTQRITLSPTAHAPGAARLEDPAVGFSFDLPAGFEPFPEQAKPAGIRYAYIKRAVGEPNSMLLVKLLGGLVPVRDRTPPEKLPAGKRISISSFNWRGLEVEAFRVLETVGTADYVSYNVQVPLVKEAIQINLAGPVTDEVHLRSLMDQILASLEGEPNW